MLPNFEERARVVNQDDVQDDVAIIRWDIAPKLKDLPLKLYLWIYPLHFFFPSSSSSSSPHVLEILGFIFFRFMNIRILSSCFTS